MATVFNFRWKAVISVAVIVVILFLMSRVPNTVITAVFSLVIYLLLRPSTNFLAAKFRSRTLSVVFVFAVLGLLLALLSLPINYLLSVEIPKFLTQFPKVIDASKNYLGIFKGYYMTLNNIANSYLMIDMHSAIRNFNFQAMMPSIFSGSASAILGIISIAADFIMALIVSAYLLIDEPKIAGFIAKHLPEKIILLNRAMWEDMLTCISGYCLGLIILGTILFSISWAGLFALNVPYSFLLSVLAGLSIIVPYVGPFIAIIPLAAVAFSKTFALGLWAVIFAAIAQFFVTSVIGPKVLGNIVGIHPVLVIFVLIIGGEVAGLMGMVLAVPLTSIFLIFLKYYWPVLSKDNL